MKTLFVVNVYHDVHLAQRLLSQLDEHYPGVDRLILPDSPRLKDILTGEWTQRYLEQALNYSVDAIVKLDPDTCVWSHNPIPAADWFGQISKDGTFIYGGACGFSRTAAERLVNSRLLYRESLFVYDQAGLYLWPEKESAMPCQDVTVGVAMKQLGIKPTRWRNVLHSSKGESPEPGRRAITHPHP